MFNKVSAHRYMTSQIYHRFLFRKSSSLKPAVYQWQRLNFGNKPAPDIGTGCVLITIAISSQGEYPDVSKELV